jgi:hypothetical protein
MILFAGVGGVRPKGRERVARMQRARRFASLAVAATLTVGGLSACNTAPDVAVYFGDRQAITIDQVQAVLTDARTRLQAEQDTALAGQAAAGGTGTATPVQVPFTGPDVVSALITHDVATALAQAKGLPLTADLPLAEAGQALGLPAQAQYTRIYVENRLLLNQLLTGAASTNPDEAEIRKVYDVFKATGQMDATLTYDKFRQSVSPEALQTLGKAVTVRNDAKAELDKLKVRVNPRYEAAQIDIYTETGPDNKPLALVSLPLSDTTGPVSPAA